MAALSLSGVVVVFSTVASLIALLVRLFTLQVGVPTALALIGLYLIIIAGAIFIVYYLIKGLIFLVRESIKLVSKFVAGGSEHESVY